MSGPIVQDFAKAETRQKRMFMGIGIALAALLTAVATISVLNGSGLELTLALSFLGVGICLWWSYSKERTYLRQQAATTWRATERGLEWVEPPNGSGALLWSEIIAMNQFVDRLELSCQRTNEGVLRKFKFSLFVGKEAGSLLQGEWESKRSNE